MAHDVFISYSSLDKAIADAVCAKLESRKIRCWIAPRDVPAGQPYAAALVNAINASKVMVLILSGTANESVHVLREVGEAVENGIPIIPLRIEDVEPTAEMRYYIKSLHWLDAMSAPIERHLDKLAGSVQALLFAGEEPAPAPAQLQISVPQKVRRKIPVWAIALFVLAAIIMIGGGTALAISIIKSAVRTSTSSEEFPIAETGSPTQETVKTSPGVNTISEEESGWTPLDFMIQDSTLWDTKEEGHYTAFGQAAEDAFAWSTETFDGDLTLSFDLESPVSQSEGCVIIYGNGLFYSHGSLIFCIESEFYSLKKDSHYLEGDDFVKNTRWAPSNINFAGEVHSVTIEIIGDTANMYVDGEKVISTFFSMDEIERRGRIGLNKIWSTPEITFSNVRIKIPDVEEQNLTTSGNDEWNCEIDGIGYEEFYPLQSQFSTTPVTIDGKISSSEEWADATCVDARLYYSIYFTNPNYQRIRWWVKNSDKDLFFLVRVPSDLAVQDVYVDYFWPEYTGTWPHSDGVYVRISGETSDWGLWDEMNWYGDEEMDPPGSIDVQAAVSEDEEFYWFEIQRSLNSGDHYDWVFEPGQTIGNNPFDTFMIGISMDEGEFTRTLQLTLGKP